MILEISINPTHPSFFQETLLDGATFRLLFRWNAREEAWYLTVKDLEDTVIMGSLKLVPGAVLLRHSSDRTTRPIGELFTLERPDRDTLGAGAPLLYAERETILEIIG